MTFNLRSCAFITFNYLLSSCTIYPPVVAQPRSGIQNSNHYSYSNASNIELIQAITQNRQDAYLYVNRSNANAEIRKDWRVIHHAAFERNERAVRALIENGADTTVLGRQKYGGVMGTPVSFGKPRSPAYLAAMWGSGKELSRYICQTSGENFDLLNAEIENTGRVGRAQATTDTVRFYKENFIDNN